MGVRRLYIPGDLERSAVEIAQERQIPPDDLMVSAIQSEVMRARRGVLLRTLQYVSGAILTAFIVVGLLWLLPKRAPLIPTPDSIYEIALVGLHWIRVFVAALLPWPLTLIVVAGLFFRSPSAFTTLLDIFSLFRRVKLFGAEIELSENTRRKLQSATDEIAVALRDYNKRVAQEAARLVSRHQIERDFAKFVDDEVFIRFGRESLGDTFRCTIHIPDPVQEGYLYQLLNYYPQGGGAYRGFSDRYGIIGKVWRSEVPEIVGTLLRELPADATQEQRIIKITRDWGMTKREAEHALKKPSYMCFLLEDDGDKVGVVYMDAEHGNAWVPAARAAEGGTEMMSENELEQTIGNRASVMLGRKVAKVLEDLSKISLRVDLRNMNE